MKKPFVYIYAGMSLDGKITSFAHTQTPIADNDDNDFRIQNRIRADAIMVGGHTLIWDDPSLTVKTEEARQQRIALGKSPNPIKVAIVSDLNALKINGDFFSDKRITKVLFISENTDSQKIEQFQKYSKVYVCGKERVDLIQAMAILYDLGIKELAVEGGGELIFSLLDNKLVDEINLKIGNLLLGGKEAITLIEGNGFIYNSAPKVEFISIFQKPNYLILKLKPTYR